MSIPRLLVSLLVVALGAFLFVYGGADDSPGAQLLGILAVVGGVAGGIRSVKKRPR
jgi:hypothetical protein